MKKIAINGMGRIGRQVFRIVFENYPRSDLELVAINDLTDIETLIHLIKYDSTYGQFTQEIKKETKNNQTTIKGTDFSTILVNGKKIKVFQESNPENLPWKAMNIDVVLECTGFFTEYQKAYKHIIAGAKKVIISAPSKSEQVKTFILGVNQAEFISGKDEIISMGSCTTNCLAPLVKILDEEFKIISGFMTTTHSYTNDQRILDGGHKDLRRARTAGVNIIPTTTGATKSVEKVLPQLKGKLAGLALRIPLPIVSILDFVCKVKKNTSKEEVIQVFREASQVENWQGILKITNEPLVSSDYIKNSYSAVIDESLIEVKDDLIKIIAWYDNEWAYSCRLVEFADYIIK